MVKAVKRSTDVGMFQNVHREISRPGDSGKYKMELIVCLDSF